MADATPRNVEPVAKPGTFQPGHDPRRGTNGGRPKVLKDIEAMLDAEHRTVENMREVFGRLKALAMGEVVEVPIPGGEGETRIELRADSRFMTLYLERTLGPVKDLEPDLSDAPQEVLQWIGEHLS